MFIPYVIFLTKKPVFFLKKQKIPNWPFKLVRNSLCIVHK